MDVSSIRFIKFWLLAVVGFVTVFSLFNCLMDPYSLLNAPRVGGLNARKPAIDSQRHLIKAYDVLRHEPRALLLGNSRVELGMDATSESWPKEYRPVYNLGLAGGGPYVSYRYLQHVLEQHHISLIVLGLDFQDFLTHSYHDPPDFETRLIVTPDGSVNRMMGRQRARDVFSTILSIDALIDSLFTLSGNIVGDSSDVSAGDWDMKYVRYVTAEMGTSPFMDVTDVTLAHAYHDHPMLAHVMDNVTAILDLCRQHGVRVIAFIPPSHADEFEVVSLSGKWPAYEAWKRELVQAFSRTERADGHVNAELWDFSGYSPYSVESLPESRDSLHWFWNADHFTRALGDTVLQRLFGAGDERFGVKLTPGNIDSRLAEVRQQQRLYRELHSKDAQRVRDIYTLAINTNSG